MRAADEKGRDCSRADAATETVAARLARVLGAVVPAHERLGLAVSGGADSLGLLAAAVDASLAPRCTVLHVDHRTGAFARRAAALTAAHAAALGVPLASAALEPPGPRATETDLRRARLEALGRLAREQRLAWVLLAHHAEDQRETVGLRLARGHRGPRALAGVACLRPLAPGVTLLRPFLVTAPAVTRAALAEAAARLALPHADDPSNADPRVPRSALRARLAADPDLAARLDRLALRSRARLAALRDDLLRALEPAVQPCGRGLRVERRALLAPAPWAPRSWHAELLRLVAASLATPCRPQLSRGLLERLGTDLAAGRAGRLELPATPAPLELLLRPDGLHLPHAAPADGPAAARWFAALASLPWESPARPATRRG